MLISSAAAMRPNIASGPRVPSKGSRTIGTRVDTARPRPSRPTSPGRAIWWEKALGVVDRKNGAISRACQIEADPERNQRRQLGVVNYDMAEENAFIASRRTRRFFSQNGVVAKSFAISFGKKLF